jgi:hypothetical protein
VSYVPGSLTVNGRSVSDAADEDAGEVSGGGVPTVTARRPCP